MNTTSKIFLVLGVVAAFAFVAVSAQTTSASTTQSPPIIDLANKNCTAKKQVNGTFDNGKNQTCECKVGYILFIVRVDYAECRNNAPAPTQPATNGTTQAVTNGTTAAVTNGTTPAITNGTTAAIDTSLPTTPTTASS